MNLKKKACIWFHAIAKIISCEDCVIMLTFSMDLCKTNYALEEAVIH